MALNAYTYTTVRRADTMFDITFDFSEDLSVGEGIRPIGGPSLTQVLAVDEDGVRVDGIIVSTSISSQTIVVRIGLPPPEQGSEDGHVYYVTCYAQGLTSNLYGPQVARIGSYGMQPF